jgi:hypothetical protein
MINLIYVKNKLKEIKKNSEYKFEKWKIQL